MPQAAIWLSQIALNTKSRLFELVIGVKDLILNPKKFMILNAALTVFWIVMVPVSILTGWVSTVEYVAALSIYALVVAHLSTYAAARTEVMQDEAASEIGEAVKRLQKLDDDHPRESVKE